MFIITGPARIFAAIKSDLKRINHAYAPLSPFPLPTRFDLICFD